MVKHPMSFQSMRHKGERIRGELSLPKQIPQITEMKNSESLLSDGNKHSEHRTTPTVHWHYDNGQMAVAKRIS
ncbi:hypothetical protein BDR04DRAFT_312515 [Suillus decipiens]|nr:hypothetical protein BDR04DRAFT_312515 [Suillus decipiens]